MDSPDQPDGGPGGMSSRSPGPMVRTDSVNSLTTLLFGSENDAGGAPLFNAPVFGTNGPRASAKEIDLNDIFADYFVMSDLDINMAMSAKSSKAGSQVGGGSSGDDSDPSSPVAGLAPSASSSASAASTVSSSAASSRPSGRGGGLRPGLRSSSSDEFMQDAHPTSSRSSSCEEPAPHPAGGLARGGGGGGGNASQRRQYPPSGPPLAQYPAPDPHPSLLGPSSSSSSSAAAASTPASTPGSTKKPKLQPSGFAGISAIAVNGPGGTGGLATVKTAAAASVKKRRRRPDPRAMTDEQRVERRERNREHAKRSRIRKKFLLESLQQQLTVLRGENTGLRQMIRTEIPAQASGILQQCMTEESFLLLDSDMQLAAEEVGGKRAAAKKAAAGGAGALAFPGLLSSAAMADGWGGGTSGTGLPAGVGGSDRTLTEPDFRLMASLVTAQQNFTVSDPSLPDNPIVYASQGFLDLTGYSREQVLGRNCRFLQGPKTDQSMVDVIRQGVARGEDTSVCLLNYKSDGTTFWNQFFVAALRDAQGAVVNFVGVQCEVNQLPFETVRERAKNLAVWDM